MCTKSLFPHYFQGRLEDWLALLRLEEYTTSLKQQKYVSVEQMTQLTWEDLEDIGITKLGHQKKVHYTILISFIQSFYFLSEEFLILINVKHGLFLVWLIKRFYLPLKIHVFVK